MRKGGAYFVYATTYNATAQIWIAVNTFSADENGSG